MESSRNQAIAGSDPQGGLRCHHCAGPLSKDMVIQYSICLFILHVQKHGHALSSCWSWIILPRNSCYWYQETSDWTVPPFIRDSFSMVIHLYFCLSLNTMFFARSSWHTILLLLYDKVIIFTIKSQNFNLFGWLHSWNNPFDICVFRSDLRWEVQQVHSMDSTTVF